MKSRDLKNKIETFTQILEFNKKKYEYSTVEKRVDKLTQ